MGQHAVLPVLHCVEVSNSNRSHGAWNNRQAAAPSSRVMHLFAFVMLSPLWCHHTIAHKVVRQPNSLVASLVRQPHSAQQSQGHQKCVHCCFGPAETVSDNSRYSRLKQRRRVPTVGPSEPSPFQCPGHIGRPGRAACVRHTV